MKANIYIWNNISTDFRQLTTLRIMFLSIFLLANTGWIIIR